MIFRILLLLVSILLRTDTLYSQETPLSISIVRTSATIELDGLIDEEVWQSADVATNFWIQSPIDGERAAQTTEIRLLYDDKNIYVGISCMDDNGYIAQTLKRDQIGDNDGLVVLLDPIGKQTNGFAFGVTSHNAQTESLLSPDGNDDGWDNRWYSATHMAADRWTAEMIIPLKSIRYESDKKDWKINFVRIDPGANQLHAWFPVPRQFDPTDLGYFGDMNWAEAPQPAGGNVSLIPYLRTGIQQQHFDNSSTTNSEVKIGGDAKVALTPTLNLDLTVNPDFSQVEVDRQVTNLSRFNIFFPERRQFFLENADIFNSYGQFANSPFYSRRLGLDESGLPVDIRYGVRLTGNINDKTRIGILNMHTASPGENEPAQNYTAAAFQRRIWKRSSIKGIFLNRQGYQDGEFLTEDYGRNLGGEFNYSTPDGKVQGQIAYIKSFKEGFEDRDGHLYGRFDYNGQLFRTFAFVQHVGTNYFADQGFNNRVLNFNPETNAIERIGYTQVGNMIDYYIYPKNSDKVNFHWSGLENFVWINADGYGLNEWYTRLRHFIFFKNTSQLRFRLNNNYVDLIFPFAISETPLPKGDYNFTEFNIQFNTDIRKQFLTEWFVVYGQFYNGTKLTYRGSVSYRAQPWGNFSLGIERNEIRLPAPYGDVDLTLATGRAEINFATNLFWTTFLQYNTQADNFNINSRLQWRFSPMSDLFIVYTDNYRVADMFGPKDRAIILKANYWITP